MSGLLPSLIGLLFILLSLFFFKEGLKSRAGEASFLAELMLLLGASLIVLGFVVGLRA